MRHPRAERGKYLLLDDPFPTSAQSQERTKIIRTVTRMTISREPMLQAKKKINKPINRFPGTLQQYAGKAEAEDAALESFCPLDELNIKIVQADHKQLPNLRNRAGFLLRKKLLVILKRKDKPHIMRPYRSQWRRNRGV